MHTTRSEWNESVEPNSEHKPAMHGETLSTELCTTYLKVGVGGRQR